MSNYRRANFNFFNCSRRSWKFTIDLGVKIWTITMNAVVQLFCGNWFFILNMYGYLFLLVYLQLAFTNYFMNCMYVPVYNIRTYVHFAPPGFRRVALGLYGLANSYFWLTSSLCSLWYIAVHYLLISFLNSHSIRHLVLEFQMEIQIFNSLKIFCLCVSRAQYTYCIY